jgi:hypothetical protein
MTPGDPGRHNDKGNRRHNTMVNTGVLPRVPLDPAHSIPPKLGQRRFRDSESPEAKIVSPS